MARAEFRLGLGLTQEGSGVEPTDIHAVIVDVVTRGRCAPSTTAALALHSEALP